MGVPYPESVVNAYRSERLIYRAIETSEADKKFLFEMENDPIDAIFSSFPPAKPISTAVMNDRVDKWKNSYFMMMACLPPDVQPSDQATEKKEPTPIGFVALQNPHGGGGPAQNRSLMLGISIHKDYRGKKYGGEMINWALDWGFKRAGLHRIELGAWGFNHNALKLYRSLGFVEEGREREAIWYDREWHDIVKFSMLEGEWEVLRGLKKACE
jgi:RimJ/RimL family protein N-acetyltransferase